MYPQARSVFAIVCLLWVIASAFFVTPLRAGDSKTPQAPQQFAAGFQLPQLPGMSAPSADWQQWDSFFTFIVKRFGQDVPANFKDAVGDAFLDSRYELSSLIGSAQASNPVPQLFLDSWQRLSPILNQALPAMSGAAASRYSSFVSAGDKLAVVGQQGAQLGLLQLSPDVLRGMARLIEPSITADPLTYTTSIDTALRDLLGFESQLTSGQSQQSWLERLHHFDPALAAAQWLVPEASAGEKRPAGNPWFPDEKQLPAYLQRVKALLVESSDRVAAKNKLAEQYRPLHRQIVLAAAWQESCWRQFIKKRNSFTLLASATGDLGLMQVNRHTWRGVYDLNALSGDISYNSNSGSEILLYYLARHAIRRGEDKHEGGNLARGTYSAYNGGPGQLGRYRAANVNPGLRKVDEAFWEKFQAVSAGHEMDVQSCYRK